MRFIGWQGVWAWLLLGELAFGQCGYSGGNCGGITPGFLVGPPSPQCSNALPLTVTLNSTATGAGIGSISYYVRQGAGAWNAISNPGLNQHVFTTSGVWQILQIVVGPGGCRDSLIQCYTISSPRSVSFVVNPAGPQCERNLPIILDLTNTTPSDPGQAFNWYVNGSPVSTSPNATHTLSAPGNYTIKLVVTDSVGCRDSASQSYVVYGRPTASFSVDVANPCRGRRICLTNTSTGTGPGTTYYWQFGDGDVSTQQNPCHRYNNPGTYTIRLIVSNGGICPDTATAVVTVQPGGLADIIGDGFQDTVKYCVMPGDPATTYTVNFTSASDCPGGGCTYTWDFGDGSPPIVTASDTPQSHTYTTFGEWWAFLTVAHPGGCVHKDSIYVVFQPVQVTAVFDIPAAGYGGCAPYTVTIQNISYTNATYFIWDFGDGQRDTVKPPSTASFTHTYTNTGTYQITLYAANACGSTFTIKGPIMVVGKPRINAVNINPNPGCAPQTYNFSINAVGVSPPNNYHWYFGPTGAEAHNVSSPTYTYTQSGAYNFMVIAKNGCGDDTFRTVIYIDTLPTPRILASPTEGCHPLSVNFLNLTDPGLVSSAPFYEELWIDGGNWCGPWWCSVNCPNYGNYAPGLGCGCCTGSTTVLPGRPMNIPTLTFTNSSGNAIRTYSVRYRARNLCGFRDTVIPIKVHPPVVARFTAVPTAVCVGSAITFQNTSWGDSLTFIWDMGDGSPLIYDTAMAAAIQMPRSHSYTYAAPGTYTVTLYVKGYCGKDTLRRTVTVYPYPTASFTVDAVEKCQGAAVFNFTNTSEVGASYSWSFPGGTPSSSSAYNPPPVTYTTPGPKTVTLTVTKNGCTSTFSQTIYVNPLPTVSFSISPSSGCSPLSVNLIQTSPNIPGYLYIWDYGNGARDTSYLPSSPVVYTNPSTSTSQSYVIRLVVVTDKGCRDSIQRVVTVRPRVVAGFTAPALVCQGISVTFTNTSSGANAYNWDFGDGVGVSTDANPTYVYSMPGTYTVTLVATNTNGCRDTFRQVINVNPIPAVTFSASPISGCVPLTVSLTQGTPFDPAYVYIWDYGNGVRDTSYTPSTPTYGAAGTYTISLEVVTPAGCRKTFSQTISALPLPTASFVAPPTACALSVVSFTNGSAGASSYNWDFGDGVGVSTATSPSYAYASPGTYTVTLVAVSGSGCRDTFQRNITIYPRPSADFSYTVECVGAATQFTDQSSGAVSWVWDFGDGSPTSSLQNPTHLYAAAGTYVVRLIVANADGCRDTITKSVPVNARPSPDFSFSVACLGQPTTFTDLTPGAPTGWQWDFGDGSPISTLQNPTHTYAAPGTYNVKLVVIAGSGCVDSLTKPVTVKPVPAASFTAASACALDQPVSFNNTSSGASSYEWNFGDGTPSSADVNPIHFYVAGGTYTVQLIAQNSLGCRDTFTQAVVVYPKPVVDFTADTVCLGGFTSFSAASDVGGTTFSWDFGDGSPVANGGTTSHVYGAAGLYTVTLIGVSPQGCRDTLQKQVWVKPLPTASFTATTPCLGEATIFTDQSIDAVAWAWDFGDGNTSTAANPAHIYAAPGSYNVTLTVWNNVGCSHTITQAVTIRPKPTADFVADTVCWTFSTSFTDLSTGAVDWLWDFGDNTGSTLQNPQHLYANAGVYTVTLIVTNAQGCEDTIQKLVVVHPRPQADFDYDTACAYRPTSFTDLTVGAATFWLWDFGDGGSSTLQNPTHVYTQGGTYQVTLVVGNGVGCLDSLTKVVAVYTMPAVDFVADTVCVGSPTHFTNLTQDSVSVSYVWLFGDGNASFSTHPTYIYQASGVYQVTLLATNAYGCDTFITRPVVVASVPQANFWADTVCAGMPTTFTDASGGVVASWIWNFGDGTRDTVTSSTIQHTYPGPGTYVVTMTAGVAGCFDAVTKGVVVVDSMRADFLLSDAVICPGEGITVIDVSTGGPRWWFWDMGDGTTFLAPQVTDHVYADSGLYTIRLVVGNGYCTDTVEKSLYVIGQPQALFSVSDVCEGVPLALQNGSFLSALPVQWLWDFGNGDTSQAMQPAYVYTRPGTYTITLILHNGRCGDTLRQTVNVWPRPNATILIRDSITRVLKETYFADVTPGVVVQRFWSLGDGATSQAAKFTYMYRDTGTYQVQLVVIDDKGCVDTAWQRVVVFGEFSMYVPTAFTPNGDGVNDLFYPGGIYFDAYDFLFQIYDRWGQLVWETRQAGQGWDGRDQRTGMLVPEDAYVFRVRGKDFKGKYHEYVGTVTVLK